MDSVKLEVKMSAGTLVLFVVIVGLPVLAAGLLLWFVLNFSSNDMPSVLPIPLLL